MGYAAVRNRSPWLPAAICSSTRRQVDRKCKLRWLRAPATTDTDKPAALAAGFVFLPVLLIAGRSVHSRMVAVRHGAPRPSRLVIAGRQHDPLDRNMPGKRMARRSTAGAFIPPTLRDCPSRSPSPARATATGMGRAYCDENARASGCRIIPDASELAECRPACWKNDQAITGAATGAS